MNLPSFWQTFMGKGPAVETVLCVWKDLTWKSLHVAEKVSVSVIAQKACRNNNFTQLSVILISSIVLPKRFLGMRLKLRALFSTVSEKTLRPV